MMPEVRSLDEAIESQKKVVEKAKKSGLLTTEFWAAVVTTIIGLAGKIGLFGVESAAAQIVSNLLVIAGPVVYIICRSGLKKEGLKEAFKWVSEVLLKDKKEDK